MKKYILAFIVVLACSVSTIVNAQNYTGSLVIYVDGKAQPATQNTVAITKSNGTAVLKIDAFKIASYSTMTITLNSTWANNNLTTPATITVTPPTVSLLLGKLSITDSNIGALNNESCNLDLKLYAPVPKQDIRVVFNGTIVP